VCAEDVSPAVNSKVEPQKNISREHRRLDKADTPGMADRFCVSGEKGNVTLAIEMFLSD
jgi:hypothetical protein